MKKKISHNLLKRLIIIITIFLFLPNCGNKNFNKGIKEIEPNNSPATATPFTIEQKDIVTLKSPFKKMGQNDESPEAISGLIVGLTGSFANKNDRDCYRINTPPGNYLVHLLPIKGINGAIEIYSPDAKVKIKTIDDFRKSDEEITPIFPTNGVAYFCVTQGWRDNKLDAPGQKYVIQFRYYQWKTSKEKIIEIEPNDHRGQAQSMAIGSELSGTIAPALNSQNKSKDNMLREEDWFVVSHPGNTAEPLFFQIELKSRANINPHLYVYSSGENPIFLLQNPQNSPLLKSPLLRIKTDEKYYLRLFSPIITSRPFDLYTLSLIPKTSNTQYESEPNDQLNEANPMDDLVKGHLSHKNDHDYYKLKIDNGPVSFGFLLTEPSALRGVKIELLDHSKKVLWQGNANEHGTTSVASLYLISGEYYLHIYDSFGNFSMENNYTLQSQIKEHSQYGEREPNNSKDKANSFLWSPQLKKIGPGYLAPGNDIDYYLIELSEKNRQRFQITLVSTSTNALTLSVTDAQGYILKKITKNTQREVTLSETIDGKGYLIIQGDSQSTGDIRNPYYILLNPF